MTNLCVLPSLAVTITHQMSDGFGEPVEATGAVSVTATDPAGEAFVMGAASLASGRIATSVTFPDLGIYTLTFNSAQGVDEVSVDVVGAVFGSLAEFKARYPGRFTASAGEAATDDQGRQALADTWSFVEDRTGRSMVPRRRLITHTAGRSSPYHWQLGVHDVRTVRSVTVDGTELDADAYHLSPTAGILTRSDGDSWRADQTIVADVEYGLDRPPAELVSYAHAMEAMSNGGSVPIGATTIVDPDGAGRFGILSPGRTGVYSRVAELNEAIKSHRLTGILGAP